MVKKLPNYFRLLSTVYWCPFLLAALIAAFAISWQGLVRVNFLYPVWHQQLHIDRLIQQIAPTHRQRQHFEDTTPAEHARLFAAILTAVQKQGEGLRAIAYRDAAGQPIDTLLTEPEILHLEDVARLVHGFTVLGWLSLVFLPLYGFLLHRRGVAFVGTRRLFLAFFVFLLACTGTVLGLGPTRVFYQLHVWVFPQNHQWFFYYEDSLMTLLMYAPKLFGYIAVLWVAVSMAVLVGILGVTQRLSRSG